MSRLGGVISTQILQFRALFIAGLCAFCVLIDFNNSIDTLGTRLCYCSHLVATFSSFAGQMPHISSIRFKHDDLESNLKMHNQTRGNLEQKY